MAFMTWICVVGPNKELEKQMSRQRKRDYVISESWSASGSLEMNEGDECQRRWFDG